MKKLIFAFVILLTSAVSANAMSYEQAREQALFLTDKMAYELDLSEEQYEAAYEINLDYLMSVNSASDLYADYWTRRNLDLSYVLLDWQYRTFCGLEYFYRPLYWGDGFWHFRIYAHYPHRDYFYYGHPHFYTTYHGGHAWHHNGGRSWYHGRVFHHGGITMRGGYDRGGYRHMDRGWRPGDGGHRGFDRGRGVTSRSSGRHESLPSTRGGSHNGFDRGNRSHNGNVGGNRSGYDRGMSGERNGRRTDAGRPSSTRTTVGEGRSSHTSSSSSYTPSRSFSGGSRSSESRSSAPSRSFSGGGSSHSGGHSSFGGGSHSGGSFGGGHSGGHGGGHSGGRR